MAAKFIHSRLKNLTLQFDRTHHSLEPSRAKSRDHGKDKKWPLSINHSRRRSKDRNSRRWIIGIDLGGTNLKIALIDFRYRIIDKKILITQRFTAPLRLRDSFARRNNLISAIVNSINNIIVNNKLNRKDIAGVGLGLPGPIDVKRGIVHFFPNIPGWKEVSLKIILQRRLRLPVFLDNDAKLMALAEHRMGAAKQAKNAFCLTLGTGVGAGIIIDGNLYRGKNNATAEIGHMAINEKGPKCNCGSMACLEAYIGNKKIIKDAKKIFRRDICLEELSELARKHNRQALALWLDVGERLGIALANIVNLLNPECIVIGGGIAGAGKALFDKVRQVISERAMRVQARNVKIFKAKLGNDAGLIGAAIMVKEGLSL